MYLCKCLHGYVCIMWMILACGCIYACTYICVFDPKYINERIVSIICLCPGVYVCMCVNVYMVMYVLCG